MPNSSVALLIQLWEAGGSREGVDRSLALLVCATPQHSYDQVADLSIGRRDARLLRLREQVLGPRLFCLALCPDCGETVELEFNVADILVAVPDSLPDEEFSLTIDAFRIQFRLPTSHDLQGITREHDPATARLDLLQRCVIEASTDGAAIAIEDLPEVVTTALESAMAEHDPQAEVIFALTCPVCGTHWRMPFDIAPFFWQEIVAQAKRLLRDVHILASAYGWSESAILALSSQRRQFYLEMIHDG